MKKLLATLAIIGATIGLSAGTAAAHTHSVTSSCETGLSITLDRYHGGTLSVTIDGTTVGGDFESSLSAVIPTDKTKAHTWTVTVESDDGIGAFTESGTIPACVTPPTIPPTPPTTTTPPPVVPPTPPTVTPPTPVVTPPRVTG